MICMKKLGGFGMLMADFTTAVREELPINVVVMNDERLKNIKKEMARDGLRRIALARASRHGLTPSARPALYAGWHASAILRQAASDPSRVADGRLGMSEFGKRARLLWVALTGRW